MKNKLVPLTEVCEFKGGSQPPKSEWIKEAKDGYIRMLQIRDFTQKNVDPEFVKVKKGMNIAKEDDILIARYGASIGKIVTGLSGTYNVALIKAIPNLEVLSKKYLYYFLKSNLFQNFLLNVGSRAAQAGFNKEDLKSLNIYLPLLKEQDKIVLLLDKTVELITKRQAQIAALDELTQSVFLEMFGDPKENKNQYPVHLLSDFYESKKDALKCGPFGSALKKEEYRSSGVPVWSMDNITKNNTLIDEPSLFVTPEKAEQLKSYNVSQGDIIISRAGTVGKMAVVRSRYDKSLISTNLIRIRLNENLLPEYVVMLIKIFGDRVCRLRTGNDGAFTHMNTSVLSSMEFPVPPLQKQQEYVQVSKEIERQKSTLLSALQEYRNLYNSILQKAFKGELFQEQA